MSTLSLTDLRGAFAGISELMARNRERLIALDGQIGDGDLGLTMAKGFASAREAMANSTADEAGALLLTAGSAIARAAPSTMGTLVAFGFLSAGRAVSGATELDLASLARLLSAFVEGIVSRGKARRGDKTVVDVLLPAAEAITSAAEEGASLREGIVRCFEAGREGLELARDMVAQHGRPAYYGEQSRGKDDPGAAAGLLILEGLRDWILAHC